MADQDERISQLNPLNEAAPQDLIPLVDVDQDETKHIRKDRLMGSPGPIGWNNRSTGEFTTIELSAGETVNEISDDDTFVVADIDQISTKRAIKAYIAGMVASVEVGNESLPSGDTTGTVVFSVAKATANYGVAWSLVNTTDFPPSIYAGTIYDKTINGFSIIFSGPMDTNNYVLSWIVSE
jgi:hypothetical protein